MPYFRTYTDFLVLLLAFYVHDVPIPFTIGNREDTPRSKLTDSLLRRVGYIIASRSREQSIQENFITQALLQELLQRHKLVMMFQNDARMKSGKFNHPTVPDVSVEWILNTFAQNKGKTIHVIPVSITKDRLLDISNLADHMVSDRRPKISLQKIRKTSKRLGGVGKIYVKFGDTIDIKQYLEERQLQALSQPNFKRAALTVTNELIVTHEAQSPVLLNNILAALLLQEQGEPIAFDDLYKNCRSVFGFLRKRRTILMFDELPPTRFELRKAAVALGCTIKQTQAQRFAKQARRLEVNLTM